MKNKKIRGGGLIYSTDKETMTGLFQQLEGLPSASSERAHDLNKVKEEDEVRVWLDRKHRGGKEVTVVRGIEQPEKVLKELCSLLKQKCGVGGSVKDREILIQGNQRDKVLEILIDQGYRRAKKAGG